LEHQVLAVLPLQTILNSERQAEEQVVETSIRVVELVVLENLSVAVEAVLVKTMLLLVVLAALLH
jgi:hypothetical protein